MQNNQIPLIFTQVVNYNFSFKGLKGHKKLNSSLDKTKKLKLQNVKEKSYNRYEYQIDSQKFQSNNSQNSQKLSNFDLNFLKSKSYQRKNYCLKSQRQIQNQNKLLSSFFDNRNKKQQDQKLMITTSKSFNNSKQKKKNEFPTFYSKNFQQKMNQYLNLVIQKSFQDQNKKLKDFQQQNKQKQAIDFLNKNKPKSLYLRKMKFQKSKGFLSERTNNEIPNNTIQNIQKLMKLRKIKNNSELQMKHSMSVQLNKQKRNMKIWQRKFIFN